MANPAPAPAPAPAPQGSPKFGTLKDARFWAASAERSVLTFFQTFAAELVVFKSADIAELGLSGLPWNVMLAVSAFAALTSFVTSIGKVGAGAEGPGFTERLKERRPRRNGPIPAADGDQAASAPAGGEGGASGE